MDLRRRAGSADAAARLVDLLSDVNHGDAARAAGWAAGRVRLGRPVGGRPAATRAAQVGDAIGALVARDLAGQVDVGRRWDALRLLIALGAAGAGDAAEALGARLVERTELDNVPYLAALLRALGVARADGAVRALVARDPAQHADPEDPAETGLLVTAMHAAGPEASDATRALADWAAEHCVIDGGQAVADLLRPPNTKVCNAESSLTICAMTSFNSSRSATRSTKGRYRSRIWFQSTPCILRS